MKNLKDEIRIFCFVQNCISSVTEQQCAQSLLDIKPILNETISL